MSGDLKVCGLVSACLVVGVVARGQVLYWGGGASDVAAKTPLPFTTNGLHGVWNATAKNWATDPAGAAYTNYLSGAWAQLGHYTNPASVNLSLEISSPFSGITACQNANTAANDYNRYFDVTSAVARTLTPVGASTTINLVAQDGTRGLRFRSNVTLAGSAPLEKTGFGIFEVQTDSSAYGGNVRVSMGSLSVSGSGSLKGVPKIDLSGRVVTATASGYGGNEFGMGTLYVTAASGANDKLADGALVTFNRSSLDYRPAAGSSETIGRVDLETWGVLGGSQGTPGGTLTLSDGVAGLTRGSTGKGMGLVPTTAGGSTYVNIRVPNGVATDSLLPWLTSGRAEFLMADSVSNNTLTRITSTPAALDVSTWASLYSASSNVRLGDDNVALPTGAMSDDLTLNTLAFFNRATNAVISLGGKTLTLAAGALSFRPGGAALHQIITNGTLRSGTGELYLHSGDSGSSGALIIRGVIAGAGLTVHKAGIAAVEFSGADSNTYTGDTVVHSGQMVLNKSAGAVAVPGNLTVRFGGSATLNQNNQVAATGNITIEAGGLIYMQNTQTNSATLTVSGGTLYFPNATITLNKAGTGLVFNGGYVNQSSSAEGRLNLLTDVRYDASATSQARFERFGAGAYNIALNGGARTFDIADSATLAGGVPEMAVDTTIIPGSPAGGSLIKTGAGTLQLTGTNTYTGGTTVNGGTLRVSVISASAQSNLTAYTSSAGAGSSIVTFNAAVARSMAVGQVITGTTFKAVSVVRVLNDYEILTSGANVMGVSTNASVTAVMRRGNLGTGPVAVTNAGTLKLDAGIAVTNTVRVFAGGTLAASGAALGPLTISGGTLAADLALGAVTVSNAVALSSATLTVAGALGDTPSTILFATGGVTGAFANWPQDVIVSYPDGNTVVVRKRRTGTLVGVL